MAAAKHPARRAAFAVALLAVSAACSTPRSRPAPVASASPGWRAVTELRSYSVHAARAVPGGVILAGERTSNGGGVLLRWDGELKEIDAPPRAAQIRAMATAANGEILLAGISTTGGGLALIGAPGAWRTIPIPSEVTQLDAATFSGSTIVVAGTAGDRGVVLAGPEPTPAVRLSIDPAPGRFARMSALAANETGILAGGTDGTHAVLASSGNGGATFRVTRPAGAAVTAAASAGREFFVGGYAGETDANRRGFLLRGPSWVDGGIPASASVGAIAADGSTVIVAVATGSGDELEASPDGGASWRSFTPGTTSVPPTVDVLAVAGGVGWAAGISGLYTGPV